jgi:hypothetical protein
MSAIQGGVVLALLQYGTVVAPPVDPPVDPTKFETKVVKALAAQQREPLQSADGLHLSLRLRKEITDYHNLACKDMPGFVPEAANSVDLPDIPADLLDAITESCRSKLAVKDSPAVSGTEVLEALLQFAAGRSLNPCTAETVWLFLISKNPNGATTHAMLCANAGFRGRMEGCTEDCQPELAPGTLKKLLAQLRGLPFFNVSTAAQLAVAPESHRASMRILMRKQEAAGRTVMGAEPLFESDHLLCIAALVRAVETQRKAGRFHGAVLAQQLLVAYLLDKGLRRRVTELTKLPFAGAASVRTTADELLLAFNLSERKVFGSGGLATMTDDPAVPDLPASSIRQALKHLVALMQLASDSESLPVYIFASSTKDGKGRTVFKGPRYNDAKVWVHNVLDVSTLNKLLHKTLKDDKTTQDVVFAAASLKGIRSHNAILAVSTSTVEATNERMGWKLGSGMALRRYAQLVGSHESSRLGYSAGELAEIRSSKAVVQPFASWCKAF